MSLCCLAKPISCTRNLIFNTPFAAALTKIILNQSCNYSGVKPSRSLVAFDFDETICDIDTDTVARSLLPPHLLTVDINKILLTDGYNEYMSVIFRLLHQQHITPSQICAAIRCIPEVPGFVSLIKRLHCCHNFDVIIISDSNSIFIAEWLQTHELTDCFTRIFTNPAHFEDSGKLCLRPYHHQTECELSAPNICKGKVLEDFILERKEQHNMRYARHVYVGDGQNDLCPVLRLRCGDIACARCGLSLDRKLSKETVKQKLRAHVIRWHDGFNLLEQLEEILEV